MACEPVCAKPRPDHSAMSSLSGGGGVYRSRQPAHPQPSPLSLSLSFPTPMRSQAGAALRHCGAVPRTLCAFMADSPLLLSVSLCPEPLLQPSCSQEAPPRAGAGLCITVTPAGQPRCAKPHISALHPALAAVSQLSGKPDYCPSRGSIKRFGFIVQ